MGPNPDIPDLFEESVSKIERALSKMPLGTTDLDSFRVAFSERYKADMWRRGAAEALVFALFCHVVAMCSAGFRSLGIVEMYAILEDYSRRELPRHICSEKGAPVIRRLLQRQPLDALANSLREIGVLTDDDVRLASRLTQFRNGIAHRNDKPIREIMQLPPDVCHFDVWHEAGKVDWIPFQLECIDYMINLSAIPKNIPSSSNEGEAAHRKS